ncbi:MAG: DUF2786 domain-containing protein [Actinomycetota bacterium]|nr:DUF2786 domain-containing protein [Actinomycetota bacterium]
MGINNRQRRADKRRQHRAGPIRRDDVSSTGRTSGPPNPGPRWPPEAERDWTAQAEALIDRATQAGADRDRVLVCMSVEALLELPDHAASGGTTSGWVLSGRLDLMLRTAWTSGWQPLDIQRVTAQQLGAAHADLAATAIASEARTSAGPGVAVPDRWRAQLSQVGAAVWWDTARANFVDHWAGRRDHGMYGALAIGLELLGMLSRLPKLPCLMPGPASWGRATGASATGASVRKVDARVLAKVRALLAKAESTTFEEEADSLTAKAQELMARYAIDQAMVHDADPDERPTGQRVWIDNPYAPAKSHLLAAVAAANRCRTVWFDRFSFSNVMGFPVDLEVVEVLYTSLLVQATRAMTAAGSVRDGGGRSRTRSFRQSFLISFASRIGERLREATDSAAVEAGQVHGANLLPVLAGRGAAVDDAVTEKFPHVVFRAHSVSNYAGWVAGRVAADQARLGPEQALASGG